MFNFFKRNDYFAVEQQVSGVSIWPNRFLQASVRRGGCAVSPGPVGRGVALSALGGFWSDGNGRGSCWVAAQITVRWEEQGWWVTRREARHPSLLSEPGHSTDRLPPSLRCPRDRMIDLLYLQMGGSSEKGWMSATRGFALLDNLARHPKFIPRETQPVRERERLQPEKRRR